MKTHVNANTLPAMVSLSLRSSILAVAVSIGVIGFRPALAQQVITNQTITGVQNPQDPTSITVGPNVVVASTGDLFLNTPAVYVIGPVSVVAGGKLNVNPGYAVGIDEDETDIIPTSFVVNQNFPNPFSSSTEIRYEVPEEGIVGIVVYNLLGQKVATLLSGSQLPGTYSVVWDGRQDNGNRASSGIYTYLVTMGEHTVSRQMTLLR